MPFAPILQDPWLTLLISASTMIFPVAALGWGVSRLNLQLENTRTVVHIAAGLVRFVL